MDWEVFIAVLGALAVLYVFHACWGQYIANPERRTYDHVRGCEDCKKRIIDGPPSSRYEDWLCPVGRTIFDRYGA